MTAGGHGDRKLPVKVGAVKSRCWRWGMTSSGSRNSCSPFWIMSARLGWANTLATLNTMSAFLGLTRSVRRARFRKPTNSLVYISRFSWTKGAHFSETVRG